MLFRIQALIVMLSFAHALRQSRQRRILKHSHRVLPPEDGTPWGMPGGGTGDDPPVKHAVPPNGKGGKGKGKGGKGSGPPGGSSTTTPAPGDSIDDGPKPTKPKPPGSTEGGPGSTEGGPGSTQGTPEPTDPMDPWQPSSTESGSTEGGPTESTSTQSGPTESTSTESGPTESTSTQSGPTQSTSTESGPSESTSTQSGPTESTSTESGPTDSGEDGPDPTDAQPDPTDGTDTQPDPTAPAEGEPAFETQGSVEEEGGLVSTCRVKPTESAPSPVTTTAKFEYLAMLKPGEELQPVLNGIEEGTHRALATHLLVCEYSARRMLQDTNFNYVTVKSTPRDELNMDKFCEDPPDGVDCYVINGGITVDHAPGEPESAVLDDIGGILSAYYDGGVLSVPNLERLVFVSFTDETTIGIDTTAGDSPNGDTPAGFEDDGNTTRSASRGTKAGAVAVAVAGVGLIIVGILILRRRRSGPRSVYLPDEVDVEDKDILLTGSDADSSTSPSSAAPPKATVLNDELDDESSYIHDDRPYDLSQYDQDATSHDPLTCDSMTCPICRERALSQNPVFVNTDLTASTYEYPREPSPEDSERSYVLPNTVEL